MDIIASIFAYLISLVGIFAAMAAAFVIYFSQPGQQSPAQPNANVAVVAKPPLFDMASSAEVTGIKKTDLRTASKADKAAETKPALPPVALDAQQKPQTSRTQLRRLADKDRAKHLAERANTDFETRFLHYED